MSVPECSCSRCTEAMLERFQPELLERRPEAVPLDAATRRRRDEESGRLAA